MVDMAKNEAEQRDSIRFPSEIVLLDVSRCLVRMEPWEPRMRGSASVKCKGDNWSDFPPREELLSVPMRMWGGNRHPHMANMHTPRYERSRRTGLGAAWYLCSVGVHDSRSNKVYTFPCEQWLSSKEQLCRDLRCEAVGTMQKTRDGDMQLVNAPAKSGSESQCSIMLHVATSLRSLLISITSGPPYEPEARNQ